MLRHLDTLFFSNQAKVPTKVSKKTIHMRTSSAFFTYTYRKSVNSFCLPCDRQKQSLKIRSAIGNLNKKRRRRRKRNRKKKKNYGQMTNYSVLFQIIPLCLLEYSIEARNDIFIIWRAENCLNLPLCHTLPSVKKRDLVTPAVQGVVKDGGILLNTSAAKYCNSTNSTYSTL